MLHYHISLHSRSVFLLAVALTAGTIMAVPSRAQKNANTPPKVKPPVAKPANEAKPAKKDPQALLQAAMQGDTAKVQALLDSGLDVNARIADAPPALMLAAIMNHPATVKLLLDRGADVNAPLSQTKKSGDAPFPSAEKGAGNTALMEAAGGAVNVMLGAKAPPEPKGYEDDPSFEKKHPAIVEKWNAQMDAWAKGYEQIVKMLLDHGADVNTQTTDGFTAIESAAASQDPQIVKMLLEKGARLDVPTHGDGEQHIVTNGFAALVSATSPPSPNTAIVRLLLEHGASPNAPSPARMTPLGSAAEFGDPEMLGLLLKAGADLDARDGEGKTALMYAQAQKRTDVVALLHKAGAKDLPANLPTLVTAQTKWARIDFPGAESSDADGINSKGQIVGNYHNSDPLSAQGFLLSNGTYTKISFPQSFSTRVSGISDTGEVVGEYFLDDRQAHGFLWNKGVFTKIKYPNSKETVADGINAQGQIVGTYRSANNVSHFFLLSQGVYTTIDPPKFKNMDLGHASISNDGQIAEFYEDDQTCRSYLMAHGSITPIASPRAGVDVKAYSINNQGQVVGELSFMGENEQETQPFLWSHGGFSKFTIPDAVSPTTASGVNDHGQFVGSFIDQGQEEHGYVMML